MTESERITFCQNTVAKQIERFEVTIKGETPYQLKIFYSEGVHTLNLHFCSSCQQYMTIYDTIDRCKYKYNDEIGFVSSIVDGIVCDLHHEVKVVLLE